MRQFHICDKCLEQVKPLSKTSVCLGLGVTEEWQEVANEHGTFILTIFLKLGVCISVWVCAHECRPHRDQARMPDSLELELQASVSYLMWVMGAKLRLSTKTVRVLDCELPPPQLCDLIWKLSILQLAVVATVQLKTILTDHELTISNGASHIVYVFYPHKSC